MQYTINKLAKMSGVSTRTLRYYDETGLLSPERINSNGYRIYGREEIDKLQQILFYRELQTPLKEIIKLAKSVNFNSVSALSEHLIILRSERERLERLIENLEKTINTEKGERTMNDIEKFDGFKQKLVDDNEKRYGSEVRAKYGDKTVDDSNARLQSMPETQYEEAEKLSREIGELLKTAYSQGNPASALARKVCEMHKKWLCFFWPHYNKEAHVALAQTYVDDPRFTAYYDKIAPGCAEFLRDALMIYCK